MVTLLLFCLCVGVCESQMVMIKVQI